MNKHTPGPWVTDDPQPGDIYRHVFNGNGRCAPYIARLDLRRGDWPTEEQEDNARLIAAAPDLLEALQRLIATGLDARAHHEFMSDPKHYARRAIAKATGGQA
jgi:hypothetical protein